MGWGVETLWAENSECISPSSFGYFRELPGPQGPDVLFCLLSFCSVMGRTVGEGVSLAQTLAFCHVFKTIV